LVRRFSVTLSKDNFESCILSFLRATSTIHDDEEARIDNWYSNDDDTIHINLVTTTERQLELPMGHYQDIL